MQQVALFLFLAFILWLFARDIKRRPGVSPALWFAFAWVVIIGSRAVSTWFQAGQGVAETNAYDQGNPVERNAYFFLLVSGLIVLFRRGVRLGELVQNNKWLAVFFIYWLLSVAWADLSFVALKRWIKDVGNLIMVLVIITDDEPIEAGKAVFVRCACLLVPLSLLFIRYYPELGRDYHVATGEMMFTGVANHKNTLGVLVMVGALFLVWDLAGHAKKVGRIKWLRIAPELGLLIMALWLLLKCRSATSLACTVVGLAIFFGLRLKGVRARIHRIEFYAIVGGLAFWALNSSLNITRWVVQDLLGRDMTLTTRTDVWPVLLGDADSSIFGSGFMSFWSGDRLSRLYEQYGIIQAHNGYLEVYLNGGWLAIVLLIILLIHSFGSIKRHVLSGGDFAVVRLMLLVIAVIHNFTEASISKGGLVWFVLLLAVTEYREAPVLARQTSSTVTAKSACLSGVAGVDLPGGMKC